MSGIPLDSPVFYRTSVRPARGTKNSLVHTYKAVCLYRWHKYDVHILDLERNISLLQGQRKKATFGKMICYGKRE